MFHLQKNDENEQKMKTPKNTMKIAIKTSGKKSTTKKKTPAKTVDEESEENDQVPDTLTFMTPKRTVRTPVLKKSPGEDAFVQLTPKLNALLERGTDSDKRRKREGKTPGKTPAEILDIGDVGLSEPGLSEAKDVNYFKKIVEETDKKLTEKCQLWESKMEQIPKSQKDYEDICSNIRSTIGKANLLMNKKGRFEQFRGLIYNCEFNLGDQKTTPMDLQGFWEMIYFQVEDIEKKFVDLEALQARNWQSEKPQKIVSKKVINKNKTAFKPKAKASSNLRQMLAEKRKAMLQQAKDDMPAIVVTEEKSSGNNFEKYFRAKN